MLIPQIIVEQNFLFFPPPLFPTSRPTRTHTQTNKHSHSSLTRRLGVFCLFSLNAHTMSFISYWDDDLLSIREDTVYRNRFYALLFLFLAAVSLLLLRFLVKRIVQAQSLHLRTKFEFTDEERRLLP